MQKKTHPFYLSSLLLAGWILLFSACTSKEYEFAQGDMHRLLDEELLRISHFSSEEKDHTGVETYTEFLAAVLHNNFDLKSAGFDIKNSEINIDQSESVLLPRVDLVVGANAAYDDKDGWDNRPEVGLVIRYNITGAIFQEDYTKVAVAQNHLRRYEREIAEKKILAETLGLLLEYHYTQRDLALHQQTFEVNNTLLKLQADADTVIPNVSGLNRDELENEAFMQQRKITSLENRLEILHNKMVHKAGKPVKIGSFIDDFSQRLAEFEKEASEKSQGEDLKEIVLESFKLNPYLSIFENRLFISRMNVLKAKREKLPHLRASLGGGALLDTGTEGTSDIVFKFEVLYPLFDAGNIKRNVRMKEISLLKTEAEIRDQFRDKVLEIRESIQRLNALLQEVEILEQDVKKKRKKVEDVKELRKDLLVNSTVPHLVRKVLLTQEQMILQSKRELSQSALQFVLHSGMQFTRQDGDTSP